MIYQKILITDQSYEVSCQDIILFHAPCNLAAPCRENESIRENWRVKMFAVVGGRVV